MLDIPEWQKIGKLIEQTTQQPFLITETRPVSGGCINTAFILQSQRNSYFIKLNQADRLLMFEAEFAGLEEIAQSNTVKVPKPILYDVLDDKSFLVLEAISLSSGTGRSDSLLGHQLAKLHQIKQAFFGWHQGNTIGSTEQINLSSDDWISFWRHNRLDFQLSLAEKNGYGTGLLRSGEKLTQSLNVFFDNYKPHPSLLHGDLWSGNASVTNLGEPIIYDPACYYGDREADIAMTELFGGFSTNFYAAYNESYPLDPGFRVRKTLYNLYHILNHLNIFGSSYLQQAQNMIDSLLSEIS